MDKRVIDSLNVVLQLIGKNPGIEFYIQSFLDDFINKRNTPTDPNVFFSLNGLDKSLLRYVSKENGFFVELGANDGVSQSNTLWFERNLGWRGVLIEPSPHKFFQCKKNRDPSNDYFCNACVSFDYKDFFVDMIYSNLMTTPVSLESDLSDPSRHAGEGMRYLSSAGGEQIVRFGAVARPLNDLLLEAQAPRLIQLLSLDVEGAEIEVLKGVDHAFYRFNLILLECRDIKKMSVYMQSIGYEVIEKLSDHDWLFRDTCK